MESINERWSQEPIFSELWWLGNLTGPNSYFAESVADYLQGRDKVVPTPRIKTKLFTGCEGLENKAEMLLSNCHFERIVPLEKRKEVSAPIIKFYDDKIQDLLQRYNSSISNYLDPALGTLVRMRVQQLSSEMLESIADTVLYDSTGELRCFSNLDLPNGSFWPGFSLEYNVRNASSEIKYVIDGERETSEAPEKKGFVWTLDMLPNPV